MRIQQRIPAPVAWLALGSLLAILPAQAARADGGVVRAIERDGDLLISVFTSPNPLVAGLIDLSVLVQDANSQSLVPDTEVTVSITPRDAPVARIELPATSQAATNKLFLACQVELEPGWYDVAVDCRARSARGRLAFAMEVGPPLPQLAVLWPWFTWPVVPIAFFWLHQVLVRKRR